MENVYNSGADGTHGANRRRYPIYASRWALGLPIGKKRRLRYVAVFWSALRRGQRLPLRTTMGMPEIKDNRGIRLCAAVPMLPTGSIVGYVRSAPALAS